MVAVSGIGSESRHGLYIGLQYGLLELRQTRHDFPMRSDHGSDAVVRGAHQVAAGLERAHAGNLKMLMRRGGITVPRIVGDIDQQRGLAQYLELAAAEGVLVADGEAELLACGAAHRLIRGLPPRRA